MQLRTILTFALVAFVVALAPVTQASAQHPPAPPTTGPTSTSTAHAFNATMTVTYDDGTTSTATIAIAGVETLTHSSSGTLLTGEFRFAASIGGCTFTGTSRARLGSGRHYSGKFECPETGKKVRFSVLVGHPEGWAGTGTLVDVDPNNPHGFGYGTGSFSGGGPAGVFTAN